MPKPVLDLILRFDISIKKDIFHRAFFSGLLQQQSRTMRNIQLLLSLGLERPLRRPRGYGHTRNWVLLLVVTAERKKRGEYLTRPVSSLALSDTDIRRRHNIRTSVMYVCSTYYSTSYITIVLL